MKIRGFEKVKEDMRKHPNVDIQLPKRGTSKAMAYDFLVQLNMNYIQEKKY